MAARPSSPQAATLPRPSRPASRPDAGSLPFHRLLARPRPRAATLPGYAARIPARRRLLPAADPAARLLVGGPRLLTDAELLSLVLPGLSSKDARRLLTHAGGLPRLARVPPADLLRHPRLTRIRAIRLAAAMELGRRTALPPDGRVPCFPGPEATADYLLARYGNAEVEEFGTLLLDSRGCLRRAEIIVRGSCDRVAVEPRDVYRSAVIHRATRLIAFHNHPTGDPTPSQADRRLTRRLATVGNALGISLVDHIVLGDGRFRSFAADGEL